MPRPLSNDQAILQALAEGLIRVDPATGAVTRSRPGGRRGTSSAIGAMKQNGYMMAHLHVGEHDYWLLIHRIVWIAIRGPIPDGLTVDHIDGDRANNAPENLRMADQALQSSNRSFRHMTDAERADMRTAHSNGVTIAALVERFQMSARTVRRTVTV